MREVDVIQIKEKIKAMVQQVNYEYPVDIYALMKESIKAETSEVGKETLKLLLDNAEIAKEEKLPICQDTGMVIIFIKVGQDVHFINGNMRDAIHAGIEEGYEEGYLRKSIVEDPIFKRVNTKNNTPAIIYTEIVDGDKVEIELGVKGFGSENMSIIKMLKPLQGLEGIKETVLEAIRNAGANACPPMVIGVGIGGTFDYAAVLAKKATLRNTDIENENPLYRQLEKELLEDANNLNIGPQGLKGKTTVLKVNIEHYPTHIAGLPVAVNISCHATRHIKEYI